MADLPEVGINPGKPTRKRVGVDPITLRVLGGAFDAIAQEMAGVLFRMSYSSIIRESEDLGAGRVHGRQIDGVGHERRARDRLEASRDVSRAVGGREQDDVGGFGR